MGLFKAIIPLPSGDSSILLSDVVVNINVFPDMVKLPPVA